MNTDLVLDDLASRGKLRRHMLKGVVYIYAVDACRACGLMNTTQAIRKLTPACKVLHRVPTLGGGQPAWLLTVDGFLALVTATGNHKGRDPIINELHMAMIRAAGKEVRDAPWTEVKRGRPTKAPVALLEPPPMREVVIDARQFATLDECQREKGYQRYIRLREHYDDLKGCDPFPVLSDQVMTEGRRISEREFQRWFRPDRARLERVRQDNIRLYEENRRQYDEYRLHLEQSVADRAAGAAAPDVAPDAPLMLTYNPEER